MALGLILHSWTKCVAMRSLHPFSPARTKSGWGEEIYIKQNNICHLKNLSHFRFHSHKFGASVGAGFHIVYNAFQQFIACGGNYSNTSGVLFSPSHSNPYPDMAECVYLISQPNGTYVNISFLSMDIDCQKVQTSDGLKADYIEMRDGSSEDSPLMARFCGDGSNVPDFMQTSQNQLRIRWSWIH